MFDPRRKCWREPTPEEFDAALRQVAAHRGSKLPAVALFAAAAERATERDEHIMIIGGRRARVTIEFLEPWEPSQC